MESKEQAYFIDACRRGDLKEVEQLCALFPELINSADAKGYTPLIIAAYGDHTAVVQHLLKAGAHPDAQDGAGNTALMGAAFKGYFDTATALINAGADINLCNYQGAPALTFAATFGRLNIARLLLEKGANTQLADNRGKTPLDHARLQENELMVQLLQLH